MGTKAENSIPQLYLEVETVDGYSYIPIAYNPLCIVSDAYHTGGSADLWVVIDDEVLRTE